MLRFSGAVIACALIAIAGHPALAQSTDTPFSVADIEAATYIAGDLPPGRSALTAKIQVLLDRSGTSPGVIDGYRGGMSESAIVAFERRAGLPMDGRMDPQVWQLLLPYAIEPLTKEYTITPSDAQGLVDAIPADYAEKAKMSAMAYTSVAERLGELFHMDEEFITFLNPGIPLVPRSVIRVTRPAKPIKSKVTRIIVDKASRRVAAYNADGDMIVDYPATVGSDATPSPAGVHKVVTVALNPNYTYNPLVNFKQGDNDKPLLVPPGPNGPVGNVWIDLSKPSYGIHGTPTPSQLFRNQSNGCVRLTNWDARELADMVIAGTTSVEFLEPGITIADVTYGAHNATVASENLESGSAAVPQSAAIPMAAAVTITGIPPRPRPAYIGQTLTAAGQLPLPIPANTAEMAPAGSPAPLSTDLAPVPSRLPGPEAPQAGAAFDPLSQALSNVLAAPQDPAASTLPAPSAGALPRETTPIAPTADQP